MPRITTQRELREKQLLDFCYLCGRKFDTDYNRNRDHVPPSSLFLTKDRDTPLILPTHAECHKPRSVEDKEIGQLIQLLHGRIPSERDMHLRIDSVKSTQYEDPLIGVRDLEFQMIVWRWIRGFHAALYNHYLPATTEGTMQAPFPGGKPLHNGKVIDEILPQQLKFVEDLKKNRLASNTDLIICRAGNCKYECFWSHLNDGRPICVFGLQIYNWEDLGDIHHFPKRGCVGLYISNLGIPVDASVSTQLEFNFSNRQILMPFEE